MTNQSGNSIFVCGFYNLNFYSYKDLQPKSAKNYKMNFVQSPIAKELSIKYFFANPYASYERGSIENLNGLIRQYIPKGKEFDDIEQNELNIIENKLNNRPRKVLDFLSPVEYREIYKIANLT